MRRHEVGGSGFKVEIESAKEASQRTRQHTVKQEDDFPVLLKISVAVCILVTCLIIVLLWAFGAFAEVRSFGRQFGDVKTEHLSLL